MAIIKAPTYVPRPMGTIDGGVSTKYLQGELASISSSIKSIITDVKASDAEINANTAAISANTASISAHEAPWTAYTPSITAGSGTITAATASGAYKKIGKTVFIRVNVVITANGTGAAQVRATLPFASIATVQVLTGRETAIAGKSIAGQIPASTTTMLILNFDNTYPGADGVNLAINGVYEAA